jgi:hypothetical protein
MAFLGFQHSLAQTMQFCRRLISLERDMPDDLTNPSFPASEIEGSLSSIRTTESDRLLYMTARKS